MVFELKDFVSFFVFFRKCFPIFKNGHKKMSFFQNLKIVSAQKSLFFSYWSVTTF